MSEILRSVFLGCFISAITAASADKCVNSCGLFTINMDFRILIVLLFFSRFSYTELCEVLILILRGTNLLKQ